MLRDAAGWCGMHGPTGRFLFYLVWVGALLLVIEMNLDAPRAAFARGIFGRG